MKLLQKSEVQSKKAAERQQTILEGAKLESRVNGLREVISEEEASLEKFRRETLARIHEETTKAAEERDSLLSEVIGLRKEREFALKPLTEELETVRRETNQLIQDRETLECREHNLGILEGTARKDAEMARDELARAQEALERNNVLLAEADEKRAEAELVLAGVQRTHAEAQALKKDIEHELKRVQDSSESNERRHVIRDQEQDKRERDLNARETKLKDREEKLLRTIKRHGRT